MSVLAFVDRINNHPLYNSVKNLINSGVNIELSSLKSLILYLQSKPTLEGEITLNKGLFTLTYQIDNSDVVGGKEYNLFFDQSNLVKTYLATCVSDYVPEQDMGGDCYKYGNFSVEQLVNSDIDFLKDE